MLNSTEHEILNAHKYENVKKFSILQAQVSLECQQLLTVGICWHFNIYEQETRLNWVEHEKSYITSGPELGEISWELKGINSKGKQLCHFHYFLHLQWGSTSKEKIFI